MIPRPPGELAGGLDRVKWLAKSRCLPDYGNGFTIVARQVACSLATHITERENLVTSGWPIARGSEAIWL